MALKEIEYKSPPEPKYEKGEDCPKCGVPTERRSVPCPDGRSGCLVMHYGWVCPQCGTHYQKKRDDGQADAR